MKWPEKGSGVFCPTNPDLTDMLGNTNFGCVDLYFCGPWNKLLEMAPNGARSFFPTNPDLANILGRMDFNFEKFDFFHFLDPKFLDFQVPRFPGPGRAWALGRVGPRVGWA